MTGTPQIITATYDLLLYLIPQVSKFPKSQRYLLGDRLEARKGRIDHKRERSARRVLEQQSGQRARGLPQQQPPGQPQQQCRFLSGGRSPALPKRSHKLQTRVPASKESGRVFEGVPINLPGLPSLQADRRAQCPVCHS